MKPGEARASHVVIYDGDCAFCSAQVRSIKKLDWFGALKFVSLTDPRVEKIAPILSREELSTAIYCVAKDGEISRAARCFRFLALRIPLLVPLAIVMWIPGVIWIAEKIYTAIAHNRSKLGRFFGCKAG